MVRQRSELQLKEGVVFNKITVFDISCVGLLDSWHISIHETKHVHNTVLLVHIYETHPNIPIRSSLTIMHTFRYIAVSFKCTVAQFVDAPPVASNFLLYVLS